MLYRSRVQKNVNDHLGGLVKARTQELEDKNVELQAAYKEVEHISVTDKLTGLRNRRFLESYIAADLTMSARKYEECRAEGSEAPVNADVVTFLFDMDNFKSINDTYGHHAGDLVLKQLARRMEKVFRQSDYFVRWGGEEFVGVARFINRTEAPKLAQRALQAINQEPFSLGEIGEFTFTCSIGYMTYPSELLTSNTLHWDSIVACADACLYAAKYSGKNCWVGLNSITDNKLVLDAVSVEKLGDLYKNDSIQVLTSLNDTSDIRWTR